MATKRTGGRKAGKRDRQDANPTTENDVIRDRNRQFQLDAAKHFLQDLTPSPAVDALLAACPPKSPWEEWAFGVDRWLVSNGHHTIFPGTTGLRRPVKADELTSLHTPRELRDHCHKLYLQWCNESPYGNVGAAWTLKFMLADVRAIWNAMRLMEGVSTPPPMPAVQDEATAIAALDEAGRWCDENEAPDTKTGVGAGKWKAQNGDAPPKVGVTNGMGVAPRNQWIMTQYEACGTDTYHKPAKIHAKWEAMKATERAVICSDSPNKISRATVEQVIKLARKKCNDQKPAESVR